MGPKDARSKITGSKLLKMGDDDRWYASVKDHRIELVGFGNGSAEIAISKIEVAISAPVRQLYY